MKNTVQFNNYYCIPSALNQKRVRGEGYQDEALLQGLLHRWGFKY
jgi:hypothetical protein